MLPEEGGLTPTSEQTLAQSIKDLAKRVKYLEDLQQLDLGSSSVDVYSQSIPDSAGTPLEFSGANLGNGFNWDIADPTKIYCTWARPTVRCCVFGFVTWANNKDGWRGISINIFNSADVFVSAATVIAHDANSSVNTNQSFCTWLTPIDETHYFTIYVTQTSGGPLDVDYALIGMMVIK